MTIAKTHQSHHCCMNCLSLLLEGPAKLCLWGLKVAAAGKGQQRGEGKGRQGVGLGFLHKYNILLQAFPEKVLRDSEPQDFASHNQLHLLHLGAQLNSITPEKI